MLEAVDERFVQAACKGCPEGVRYCGGENKKRAQDFRRMFEVLADVNLLPLLACASAKYGCLMHQAQSLCATTVGK